MPRQLEPGEIAAKLERITGLTVRVGPAWHGDPPWEAYTTGAYKSARSVYVCCHTSQQLIREFLRLNLSNCRDILLAKQQGRCLECPAAGVLELDHIEPRSHGRNDRIENLQLLCHACHRCKTGEPQWSHHNTSIL